jgi:hypothetical protein
MGFYTPGARPAFKPRTAGAAGRRQPSGMSTAV